MNDEDGGAPGKDGSVQRIVPLATDVSNVAAVEPDRARFDVHARWQVEGAVFHWGHAHWRVQELAADYTVASTDAGWRLTASEITEQVLVSATQDRRGEDGALEPIPEEL